MIQAITNTRINSLNKGIQLSQIFKEKGFQLLTHGKFTKEFGGKVFYIYSTRSGDKKIIVNYEVIDEIKKEISNLEK